VGAAGLGDMNLGSPMGVKITQAQMPKGTRVGLGDTPPFCAFCSRNSRFLPPTTGARHGSCWKRSLSKMLLIVCR
jgi:hypothetical protein